jgi:hypothetical protein
MSDCSGADGSCRDKEFLEEITPEVIENVQGQVIKPGCEDEVE